MGKEGRIEKHPSQEEEDLEIKTSEELEEAKKEAGVSTHKEALKRYGEIRKKEKETKKEITKEDWKKDGEEAKALINAELEEEGRNEGLTEEEIENDARAPYYRLLENISSPGLDDFFERNIKLLKKAGREDLIEAYTKKFISDTDYFLGEYMPDIIDRRLRRKEKHKGI